MHAADSLIDGFNQPDLRLIGHASAMLRRAAAPARRRNNGSRTQLNIPRQAAPRRRRLRKIQLRTEAISKQIENECHARSKQCLYVALGKYFTSDTIEVGSSPVTDHPDSDLITADGRSISLYVPTSSAQCVVPALGWPGSAQNQDDARSISTISDESGSTAYSYHR